MIIPDANLLIYAHDEQSPFHPKARVWWESVLAGSEPVGVPWIVVLAFVRLMTHPQICAQPLSVEEARVAVTHWVDSPMLRIIQLSGSALTTFFDLLEDAGMGGNLTTDALIALYAREHSGTIYSNDRDFDRFKGLRRGNPLV